MARKLFLGYLINKQEITEELKLIEGSVTDYITPSGKVYKDYGNNQMFLKQPKPNKRNGYVYCGITMANGKNKSCRVHRLVAKAYVPNPHNYPIVCHKDDIKTNNHYTNLEWGTVQKNTQDAYDRGLACNDKGYEDSQSMPVYCFDLNKTLIQAYGSVSIAAKETGFSKHGILYQCNHLSHTKPRKGYYFRFQKEYDKMGFVL